MSFYYYFYGCCCILCAVIFWFKMLLCLAVFRPLKTGRNLNVSVLCICLSVCLPVYLSIFLSVCLSIYLSIYLSIFVSRFLPLQIAGQPADARGSVSTNGQIAAVRVYVIIFQCIVTVQVSLICLTIIIYPRCEDISTISAYDI